MTFRQMVVLSGLILMGAVASYFLRSNRPLGQYVGDNAIAARILEEHASPEVLHGNADLTLIIFTDYQCPACRKSDPAMRAAIAQDGNVRVVYKDWPIFGEVSRQTAVRALASVNQGIYPSVHHGLMASANLDEAGHRHAIEVAGGSWRQLQFDEKHQKASIDAQLTRNAFEAFSLGLEGTPGYLVGPFLIKGALTEREFIRAFAQARAAQ